MSVASISNSAFSGFDIQSSQSEFQKFQQELKQLGQDLQSGNLSAAQADFVTLQQDAPQSAAGTSSSSATSTQSENPIEQAFKQLAQDLQSGNLTAAQQDFATIQQDTPQSAAKASTASTQSENPIEQAFKQLGQDLQSGNLSAAQADFATIQQDAPQRAASASSSSTTSTQSENPIEQAFNQLAQDLQSGNLTAAQKDYATIQQDFKNQAAQQSQASQGDESTETHHHHHHSGSSQNGVSQLFSQLGQELQSGDLTSAQQTYTSLEKDFAAYSQQSGQTASGQSSTSSVSVNA